MLKLSVSMSVLGWNWLSVCSVLLSCLKNVDFGVLCGIGRLRLKLLLVFVFVFFL